MLSHRRLARAFLSPDARDQNAALVVANVRATERAIELAAAAEDVTVATLVEIHKVLFTGTRDDRLAGVIREQQNWIGGRSDGPKGAEFVPPPFELVPDELDDLCRFVNRDDVPAVIQAAIAQAQFETIHPFLDGNGRVGRALIHVVLRRRDVTPRYAPPYRSSSQATPATTSGASPTIAPIARRPGGRRSRRHSSAPPSELASSPAGSSSYRSDGSKRRAAPVHSPPHSTWIHRSPTPPAPLPPAAAARSAKTSSRLVL